jgi:hypothetical protein
VAAELCRTIAYEAVRRGARENVHELWAVLERVDDTRPRLIVDIGSGPAMWWALWAMGAHVVATSWVLEKWSTAFSGTHLPDAIVDLTGDPRDPGTVLRVSDQVARRPVDVLVIGGVRTELDARVVFHAYGSMVRDGGLVLLHGIADRKVPGVAKFWKGLVPAGRKELVGSDNPIGYGVLEIGKDRAHA